ncbi:MAG: hypothetical protein ACP5MH_12265, partial [Thermoproteus sp.]
NETWAPAGSRLSYPGAVFDLGNGTRIAVSPLSLSVDGPISAAANYTVYYLVVLETPLGANETWAARGSRYSYAPPPVLYLDNGTALSGPNGTCSFVVEGPRTCAVRYAERLYRISVRTPLGANETWLPEGHVLSFPPVVDLGNGTRLVGPEPPSVVVEGPADVAVSYSRQYWVSIRLVTGVWEGWVPAGSAVEVNSTYIDGVLYVPVVSAFRAERPLNASAVYIAYYNATLRDPLGVPNPLASVSLCGASFPADPAGRVYASVETRSLCTPEVYSPLPLSPYTIAAIAAAATAVGAAVWRRRRR